jgi:hypothetical protein
VLFGNLDGEFNLNTPLFCKEATLLSYLKNPKEKEQNILQIDLETLNKNGNVKAHKNHDVVVVYIGNTSVSNGNVTTSIVSGIVIRHLTSSGILIQKIEFTKKFDEVLTANDVYVFGYPGSIGLSNYLQIDYQKPRIRRGIVAGTDDQKKTIILDCFIFPGNSGGPVLQEEWTGIGTKSFWTIGVVSEFIPIMETWLNERFKYRNTQMYIPATL